MTTETQTDPIPGGNPTEEEHLQEMARRLLEEGAQLHELQNLSTEELDALYHLGHNLHGAGAYDEAVQVFELLTALNDANPHNWLALGVTLRLLGRHGEAIEALSVAQELDPDNPLPTMNAYESILALGDLPRAAIALRLVLLIAGGNPDHSTISTQAEALLGELEKTTSTAA
jgi:type III secretion system low calcium response chaperone LcrH/SycD